VILASAALMPRPVPVSDRAYAGQPMPSSTSTSEADVQPANAIAQLHGEVKAAVSATEWPQFDPPIETLADQKVPQWTENGCLDVTDQNIDLCAYGNTGSDKVAVVIGDSTGTSWLPAIVGALEPRGYRVQALTLQGCPVAYVSVFKNSNDKSEYTRCTEHQSWVADQVARIAPDLIILSESHQSMRRLMSEALGAAAETEWKAGFTAAIGAFPADSEIVILTPPPGSGNLQECYTPVSAPPDCGAAIPDHWNWLKTAELAVATDVGATLIDTVDWFCAESTCPAFVGSTPIYTDRLHLTATFSTRLIPVVTEALTGIGSSG
jgi:hypothetical protein